VLMTVCSTVLQVQCFDFITVNVNTEISIGAIKNYSFHEKYKCI
jgi:hypothetical protein